MTLELIPETCEVCDRGGDLDSFHGLRIHTDCAPAHWREDRQALEGWLEDIDRKRET